MDSPNKQAKEIDRGYRPLRGRPGRRGRRHRDPDRLGSLLPNHPPWPARPTGRRRSGPLATRWRWMTIVGVIVSLFLLVGGALAPQARDQLGDPTQVGVFIGTVIQLLALVVALLARVAATRQLYRTQTRA